MKRAAWILLLLSAQDPKTASPTFTRDVAPIIYSNCASCHRAGEVAPFPLVAYADVKKRMKQILAVVESRRMPPWKPAEGHGDFVGERRISAADVEVLRKWVGEGGLEGDPKDLPAMPKFPEGWAFGEPDLVVEMPEAYSVPAEGRDILRSFVVPLHLTEDKYVRAAQFRPSNPRVVHHALIFMDITGESRKKDDADPGPGFGGQQFSLASMSGGGIAGWSPGAMIQPLPDGLAKLVQKKADIVMQMHFNPTGKVEQERSRLGLWFSKEKPTKLVAEIPMADLWLDLPAGESHITGTMTFVLPADVEMIGIAPHGHFLGKECKVWAEGPDGKEIPLIWIKDWDFNWQEQYRFKQLVRLPKGSKMMMTWTFDNSASNPRQPTNPPRRVRWGVATADEMASTVLEIVPVEPQDLRRVFLALLRGTYVQTPPGK
jgi:hypothetical protein